MVWLPARFALLVLLATALGGHPLAAQAADPYEINAILSLTGPASFVGQDERVALDALETIVNKDGGIGGRPVKFVIADDQSNQLTVVQLVNGLIAKKVPVILGPGLNALCSAAGPLVKDGPVLYCLSPGLHPAPASFVFSSGVSTSDLIIASVRYFRDRGWDRIALIASTDSGGQDGERSFDAALALRENRALSIVDREHFNVSDLSVAAQIAHIKAAHPQVIVAWTAGAAVATILRGASDAELGLPIMTPPANATYAQMQQYEPFLPKELYFPGSPAMAVNLVRDRQTKAVVDAFIAALSAKGVKASSLQAGIWDPAQLTIAALRKLGTGATGDQIRAYVAGLKGWYGVGGRYDFPAIPQRGIGIDGVYMTRWDPPQHTWIGVSRAGGSAR